MKALIVRVEFRAIVNIMKQAVDPWIVLKFGGSSVCELRHWQTIARLIQQAYRDGFKVFVVCSAIRGVTDALEKLFSTRSRSQDASVGEEFFTWIRTIHQRLATCLNIEMEAYIDGELAKLAQLMHTDSNDCTPRMQAEMMALGEVMCTKLGVAWLKKQGLSAVWQDARALLTCRDSLAGPWDQRYLAATCTEQADPRLQAQFRQQGFDIVITQGFIASDSEGHTVLLGRGGSDTSAAYFSARLQAKKLEIWTDVPGMFTLDPRKHPEASLLAHLSYQEAEQMAVMGAKVLHPRCIAPVRTHGIPLYIRCTETPELLGTHIGLQALAG